MRCPCELCGVSMAGRTDLIPKNNGITLWSTDIPNIRWNSLHTFLPFNLRQLTIELDTYSKSLHMTCHNLCCGLELYLKQVDSEPAARWAHFRDVVTLRLPATKGLKYQILDARAACSTES